MDADQYRSCAIVESVVSAALRVLEPGFRQEWHETPSSAANSELVAPIQAFEDAFVTDTQEVVRGSAPASLPAFTKLIQTIAASRMQFDSLDSVGESIAVHLLKRMEADSRLSDHTRRLMLRVTLLELARRGTAAVHERAQTETLGQPISSAVRDGLRSLLK